MSSRDDPFRVDPTRAVTLGTAARQVPEHVMMSQGYAYAQYGAQQPVTQPGAAPSFAPQYSPAQPYTGTPYPYAPGSPAQPPVQPPVQTPDRSSGLGALRRLPRTAASCASTRTSAPPTPSAPAAGDAPH